MDSVPLPRVASEFRKCSSPGHWLNSTADLSLCDRERHSATANCCRRNAIAYHHIAQPSGHTAVPYHFSTTATQLRIQSAFTDDKGKLGGGFMVWQCAALRLYKFRGGRPKGKRSRCPRPKGRHFPLWSECIGPPAPVMRLEIVHGEH